MSKKPRARVCKKDVSPLAAGQRSGYCSPWRHACTHACWLAHTLTHTTTNSTGRLLPEASPASHWSLLMTNIWRGNWGGETAGAGEPFCWRGVKGRVEGWAGEGFTSLKAACKHSLLLPLWRAEVEQFSTFMFCVLKTC